jgi:hypothetical protein
MAVEQLAVLGQLTEEGRPRDGQRGPTLTSQGLLDGPEGLFHHDLDPVGEPSADHSPPALAP